MTKWRTQLSMTSRHELKNKKIILYEFIQRNLVAALFIAKCVLMLV